MNSSENFIIIHKTKLANIALLDEIANHITSFVNMLKTYIKLNSSITIDPPDLKKKSKDLQQVQYIDLFENPDPTLSTSWNKIGKNMFGTQPVLKLIECINIDVLDKIKEIKNNYLMEISEIEESIKLYQKQIETQEIPYRAAQKAYNTLCSTIEKGHSNANPNLMKLKFNFKDTQLKMVSEVIEMNKNILNYNLRIEKVLSKYEDSEKQRFLDLRKCLIDFSKSIEQIIEINQDISEKIRDALDKMSSRHDMDKLISENELEKQPSIIKTTPSSSASFESNENQLNPDSPLKQQSEKSTTNEIDIQPTLNESDHPHNESTTDNQNDLSKTVNGSEHPLNAVPFSQTHGEAMKDFKDEIEQINLTSQDNDEALIQLRQIADARVDTIDEIILDAPKSFTFDINEYITPSEIFQFEITQYLAEITEDISDDLHKGDEVTVICENFDKCSIVTQKNEQHQILLSQVNKLFERTIKKVALKPDDEELEVNVGDNVLVLNEKAGLSLCLSMYRTQGLISTDKLTDI